MPTASPLITVGVAVYNGETFLAETILSVLDQTYSNWELLLVNDHSTDDSAALARSFTDHRIRMVENQANIGLVGVRNRILAEARGRYLAWLDQDDLALASRLAKQVSFLEARPEFSVCGAWTHVRTQSSSGVTVDRTERLPIEHSAIRSSMIFMNPIACHTVVMRRSDFVERQLWFREAFGNSLDYDMWSRVSDDMLLCALPEVLGVYRVHESQTSQGAALATMNRQALQVQCELVHRALRIEMNPEQRRIHALGTIAPIEFREAADLDALADWFALLLRQNLNIGAFEPDSFAQAMARQWATVCLGAKRSLGTGAAARAALAGATVIGLPLRASVASVTNGIQRKAARRR